MLTLFLAALVGGLDNKFHAPSFHQHGTAPSPAAQAPDHKSHLVDLAPITPKQFASGFSNPFRQYEGGSIPGWAYGGDATLFNDYLSLTPASPNRVGYVWATHALEMPSWEVEFEFHIGGAQARGSGGGLAFWWAAEPAMPGTIYGHADTFNGVGIFLDTYEPAAPSLNIEPSAVGGNEPYLVAMVNDGSPIGGDLLRDANKLAAKQAAVCFARYRNLAHIARVRIAWASGTLRLWLDLEGSRVWQPCFETKVGDEKMSKMPTSGYFGLSASTGPYGDAHVIYSMSVAKLDPILDDVVLATPHHAVPGETPLDPAHEVHAEASDHETHVTITPNEMPVEHHAEPGAEPQHPNPVHVPPTQPESEQLAHAIAALESAHELREAIAEMKEELEQLEHGYEHTSQQVLTEMKTVLSELRVVKDAVLAGGGGGGGAHHAASSAIAHAGGGGGDVGGLAGQLEAVGKVLDDHHRLLTAVSEKVDTASLSSKHADLEATTKAILGKAQAIERETESHTQTLNAHLQHILQEVELVKKTGSQARDHSNHELTLMRHKLEAMEKAGGGGGGGGGTFALAVCAQALVVAAVLFYAMSGGGGKRHSHLP